MNLGLIKKVDIDHEMQQSYLDYAMSVIVARALPDARDGLKPVQRRILYAMADMGLRPETATKKSARIVGEVLGKYHPHGDMSVYEAMARLAQDFTIRYPLVEGQGNFGSVDGDPPAAMRYTEAKLSSYAMELLAQLQQDTVNFVRNFDDSLDEPEVLPAAAPNLLVNGASGIAVGMATNIPPHNLGEVIDALVYMLGEWDRQDDISVSDIMKWIKGPDFPTGGMILQENNVNELMSTYATGRGRFTLRGRIHVEEMGKSRNRLIITELPYQVNKSSLIEKIAELVREGNLEGISDLRDESDRHGMRIVIELSRTADTDRVLLSLYKRTPLQTTFGMNMLALVDGEPRLLSIKQALRVYIEHRLEVVRRRSAFELDKAKKRLHILDGLRIALQNLDEVIALIRNSPDAEKAGERLRKRFKLSEVQAQAILEMPLRRLAALERKKIELEYKELKLRIKELETLLRSPKKMRQLIISELQAVRQTYQDRRKTQIVQLGDEVSSRTLLTVTDMTPENEIWVMVSSEGLIGRTVGEKPPRLSGRQAPDKIIKINTRHTLYLAAQDGTTSTVLADSIPEVEKIMDGVHYSKVSNLRTDGPLADIFSLPPAGDISGEHFLVGITCSGMVKKTALSEVPGHSGRTFEIMKILPNDQLGWVGVSDGGMQCLLVTAEGMGIRFSEEEVRPMGLVTGGVNGVKLKKDDYLVGGLLVNLDNEILLAASNGFGWRIPLEEFPVQGRYGQGTITCKLPENVLLIGVVAGKKTQSYILHYSQAASSQLRIDDIPLVKRHRAGQPITTMKPGDRVNALTSVMDGLLIWKPMPVQKRKGKK